MSKAQVLFSNSNTLGAASGTHVNYWEHQSLKGREWGANGQVEKLFPRGKAYWKMFDLQISYHMEVSDGEE